MQISCRIPTAAGVALTLVLAVVPLGSCLASETGDVSFPVGQKYLLKYEGGMRFKAGTFGSSRVSYNAGPFAVGSKERTVWIAGHTQHFSIGAFALEEPVKSTKLNDLPIAANKQPFVRMPGTNLDGGKPDRVTGLQLIDDKLFVNVTEYYDANTDNKSTTMVFERPLDLANSSRIGYLQMQGNAHAAGWMSPVPDYLQEFIGGEYIAGHASNLPIISRNSVGPSLFLWRPKDVNTEMLPGSVIATKRVIDYSLKSPLHEDLNNSSVENELWTSLSRAYYGFVPPGTRDYFVIGRSGGHNSGIGYKITPDGGRTCAGYCAYSSGDYYNYFWRYDLSDVERLRAGEISSSDMRPVEYGVFPVVSGSLGANYQISGATFDPSSARVYVLIYGADAEQAQFERQPVLLVYSLWIRSSEGLQPILPEMGAVHNYADGPDDLFSEYRFIDESDDGRLWDASIELESGTVIAGDLAQFYRTYVAARGEQPDEMETQWWQAQFAAQNHNLRTMVEGFLWSDRFLQFFKGASSPEQITNDAFVSHLYRNILGREPDAEGYAWWLDQLNSGGMSQAQALVNMTKSNEFVQLTVNEVVAAFGGGY